MNKKLWIGGGLLALVLAGGAAYAAMAHGGMHGGRMMKHMISARIEDAEDYIDATPQQRVTIEQAKENIFKALEAKAQSRKAAHEQILGLLAAKTLDTATLNKLVDDQVNQARDIGHAIVDQVASVHAALTPDQRAKLIERFKQHHGHGGPGGFGGPPQE